MSARDLAGKYGRGNTRNLINRAIRAELVGGDHCLDAMNSLDQLAVQWRRRGWVEGLAEIEGALSRVRTLYSLLGAEIRRRYDMPEEGR